MTTYANPGAIADVPPSPNKIESTWGNAMRDRVVNNFASAAARDAAITAPILGMFCYVAGTGLLQYAGATDGWTAPWNLAWGYQTREVVSTSLSQATISTIVDVTGMTITFTALASRRLRFTWRALMLPTVATDRIQLLLATGAGTAQGSIILVPSITANVVMAGEVTLDSVAGSNAYKLRAVRLSGTGTFTLSGSATDPAILTCEDMGPSANPV